MHFSLEKLYEFLIGSNTQIEHEMLLVFYIYIYLRSE